MVKIETNMATAKVEIGSAPPSILFAEIGVSIEVLLEEMKNVAEEVIGQEHAEEAVAMSLRAAVANAFPSTLKGEKNAN